MTGETAFASHHHLVANNAMKNSFTILLGSLITLCLLSYMFLYQVRYDQVAVRTTFDRADDGSVQNTPGLKWLILSALICGTQKSRSLRTHQGLLTRI